MNKVHVLVFEGFADWEPAFALAELRRWGHYEVVTVGFVHSPIRSMGGLRIMPDLVVGDVRTEDVAMLILPGGDLWDFIKAGPYRQLHHLVSTLVDGDRPIAAICAATTALARMGLRDSRRHTSNSLTYLFQLVPSYGGHGLYEDILAVRDRGVITASGFGAVAFAREIFLELGLFSTSDVARWFDMHTQGRPAPACD
jgi:putative intracellular protease/amidase